MYQVNYQVTPLYKICNDIQVIICSSGTRPPRQQFWTVYVLPVCTSETTTSLAASFLVKIPNLTTNNTYLGSLVMWLSFMSTCLPNRSESHLDSNFSLCYGGAVSGSIINVNHFLPSTFMCRSLCPVPKTGQSQCHKAILLWYCLLQVCNVAGHFICFPQCLENICIKQSHFYYHRLDKLHMNAYWYLGITICYNDPCIYLIYSVNSVYYLMMFIFKFCFGFSGFCYSTPESLICNIKLIPQIFCNFLQEHVNVRTQRSCTVDLLGCTLI